MKPPVVYGESSLGMNYTGMNVSYGDVEPYCLRIGEFSRVQRRVSVALIMKYRWIVAACKYIIRWQVKPDARDINDNQYLKTFSGSWLPRL
jgi:hypothetical protein